ncbi:uncharacterized protein LOC112905746 [Agrilus planipennis]|uniref:Uncharacterized protein LOC112905746 n=1 Tax=Agrilus planipennis TaxID=224129 RepID=A0A7F5RF17_AGRPL|nr:uncharacterized protein LOC112905746 [Agrilus planipennis]
MWNKQDYLPCLPHQTDKCIYVGFFHDGYVNCPYPGCVDENECSPEGLVSSKKSNGNVVLLSSLSTLAVLFCVFIIGIYLCRKYSKLCWNHQFAVAETNEANVNRSVLISGPVPTSVGSQSGPYATSTALSTEENKDLPPSYESLFPDR